MQTLKKIRQCCSTDYPQFLPSHEATDCFAVATATISLLFALLQKRDDETLHHIEFT